MKTCKWCLAASLLCLLVWSVVQSSTPLDLLWRAELSSDSANVPVSVWALVSYGGRLDTVVLSLVAGTDSLIWRKTLPDTLDSVGVYNITYLVGYADSQKVPYQGFVNTAGGSAVISSSDKYQIASLVGDTLVTRGFLSPGVGDSACSVFVYDTVNSVGVEGVTITVLDAGRNRYTRNMTEGDGYARFNLDSGTYYLRPAKTGFIMGVEDTFSVVSTLVDTVFGYPFTPASAPLAYQNNIWGWFYGIDGTGKSGVRIEARLTRSIVERAGIIISNFGMTDTTDTAGYWQLTLLNNDSLSPAGTQYKFRATDSGQVVGAVNQTVNADALLDWTR